ncbi:putative glutathione-specific gamma-glutamylcyclotransferase 2 isoform X1 [Pollicipes pollicipes]|uniref:putative glutathione-specific gamma-glutamylcyclotransferase 2 isoform X1 n=2 Tax=Pollicipes pollicipes TaxID=41117 RepID=UPI0018852FCA|nr:putative glutathione-specific gamma-glutamylcyclotransferase 2 isoform X1 [Pollicipes pollicipes]
MLVPTLWVDGCCHSIMWIFGYGSLIWKVDFPFKTKEIGYIKGYVRRFWQASIDHRGTPEKPGRVATLVPSEDPEARVWGVAYEIPSDEVQATLSHLDYRERCGYERRAVTFHPQDGRRPPHQLTIYVGTEDNPYFTGPTSEEELAAVVVEARGMAGPNTEYLYNLAEAVRATMPHAQESHLFILEQAVRKRERSANTVS